MHYRYKRSRHRGSGGKYLVLFVLVLVLVVVVVRYRSYLLFWQHDLNEMNSSSLSHVQGEDRELVLARLEKAREKGVEYIGANPLSIDAYFLQAHTLCRLGEVSSDMVFSKCIAYGERLSFTEHSRAYFFDALRLLRKGMVLDERQVVPDELLLLNAKLLYYTGYSGAEAVYSYVEQVQDAEVLASVEDRRFYGVIQVLRGEVERGIYYLRNFGSVQTFSDQLFLAGAYKSAAQYTDAIVLYKELLQKCSLVEHEVLIRMSLGEIYLEQLLYDEALEQLLALQLVDSQNREAKKMIGTIYLELGDKKSAQAYLGFL